jgi:hypothetical protein
MALLASLESWLVPLVRIERMVQLAPLAQLRGPMVIAPRVPTAQLAQLKHWMEPVHSRLAPTLLLEPAERQEGWPL